jgi:methyltransferase-like protein/2-polyprenyl-3-methyl-5-hydroxy-6-metoxy-1,4-benzoquinol methylase
VTNPTNTPYDETPYPAGPYQQAHLDRLETLAKFFGMRPADIRRCRVLELGAADGSNLIPMACALPCSEFAGIDLAHSHVEAGRQTIAALGLSNIDLSQLDILDVDDRFGTFDYVIVHGVYSWVPANVQEQILRICSQTLSENGVAYVSYNTNPGWRMRGLLRDMMLYHTRKFDDPNTRIGQARALVEWLTESVASQTDPYGMLLRRELDQMRTWHDAYFRHDSLGEINEPLYFHEFIKRAEDHGLQYLAEAEFTPMLASNYAPEVDEALNRMSRDIIEVEQYMDFLRNRLFRQTLLCHRGVKLNRALGPWSVEGFQVGASLRCVSSELSLEPDKVVIFRGAREMTISTSEPLVKAALMCLAESWPEPIPFDDLLARSRSLVSMNVQSDTDRRVLGAALLNCYTKGLCELQVHAPRFGSVPGNRPCACPLVRLQAARGNVVTNRRHERVYLDEIAQRLLPFLDGKHERKALLRHLDPTPDVAVLESELDKHLVSFARRALLLDES